jgi:hypothetical protein
MQTKYDYSSFVSPNFRFVDVETGLLSFYVTVSRYDHEEKWFLPEGLTLFDMIRVEDSEEDRKYMKHHEESYRILCGYESHVLEVSARSAGCEFHPA